MELLSLSVQTISLCSYQRSHQALSSISNTMQTILTCRMLFQLRQYGSRTMRRDGSTVFNSDFMVPMESMVFQQNAAAIGRDLVGNQHISHMGCESGNADEQVVSGSLRGFHGSSRSSMS
jgi:hypothetical protein